MGRVGGQLGRSVCKSRQIRGGGTGGTGAPIPPPLKCEILTLTLWALHGKNDVGGALLGRSRSAPGATNTR